jgi:hypothetical protein
MKRNVLHILAMSALLTTVGVAQSPTPAQTPPAAQTAPVMQEMKLAGCLVKGVKPNVYLLERAADPTKKDDVPRTYRLQAQMEDPDFETHVNAKIEVVGKGEIKTVAPPPPGGKIDEKDLPVFAVTAFQHLTDTCSF